MSRQEVIGLIGREPDGAGCGWGASPEIWHEPRGDVIVGFSYEDDTVLGVGDLRTPISWMNRLREALRKLF